MHVGFTGTRLGLTDTQGRTLAEVFDELCRVTTGGGGWVRTEAVLHHGDCIGADAVAHRIARRLEWRIERHPPVNDAYRAFCDYDRDHPALGYHERNRAIVHMSQFLVACPKEPLTSRSGGTWYTINYAVSKGKTVHLVFPSGDHTFM